MKFLTFAFANRTHPGAIFADGEMLDLASALRAKLRAQFHLPSNVGELILEGEPLLKTVRAELENQPCHAAHVRPASQYKVRAPIPQPGKNIFFVGRNYRGHIVEGNRAGGVDISREKALDHVLGFTIENDVTARELPKRHGQWFKGKSLDTFCPMGLWVVHRSDVMTTRITGFSELRNTVIE